MSKTWKEVIAEIKMATDIVDYISKSGTTLKPSGTNKFKGLCPFHSEKTPSFVVDENFKNYRCFGCGAHGDIITFVQEIDHLDWIDAVKKLADDNDISLDMKNMQLDVDRKSVMACLNMTSRFFYHHFQELPKDHVAKKQILSRGLSIKDKFYGYAPETRGSLVRFLQSKGFTEKVILDSGVCGKSSKTGKLYDFWNGRLMFYIRDNSGKVVGFSGRKLFDSDNRGKYVNSKDGPLFNKSYVLFNFSDAKDKAAKDKEIYIVEGQFDVAAMVDAGMTNVAAASGSAFTTYQANMCRRLVTEDGSIIFCFDGDSAGVGAAEKVFKHNPQIHQQAFVVSFPNNNDPCDFRAINGSIKLHDYVENHRVPIVDFMIKTTMKDYDLDNQLDKSRFISKMAIVLKTISNETLRESYIRKVALDSFTSMDVVQNEVDKAEPMESPHEKSDGQEKDDKSGPGHPEIEVETSDEQTVELIGKSDIYDTAARWIRLSLSFPSWMSSLERNMNIIPKRLKRFAKELVEKKDGPFIAESFTDVLTAEKILGTDFFPLYDKMTEEDKKEQFIYLHNLLSEEERNFRQNHVKKKVSDFILNSDGGVDVMKVAIEKENELLGTLEKS